MNDTNKERAAFEAWYFAETDSRLFCESQWRAWQARAAKAPAAEPFAYCQPDDPLSSTAFVWPGIKRDPRHTMPLYTAPPAPTEQWMPIEDIPAQGSFQVYMPDELEGHRIQTMVRHPNVTSIGNHFDFDMSKPTHYRNLPAPPQGAAKGANDAASS